MLPHQIAQVIDHTYLKDEKSGISTTEQKIQVEKLVREAHQGKTFSVCVRESLVAFACQELQKLNSKVKVCSVIGFPVGDDFSTKEKINLLERARKDGAHEFDMVMNVAALKRGNMEELYQDIKLVSEAAGHQCLKVILEMAYLNHHEKLQACDFIIKAFEDSKHIDYRFLKTSTGFAKVAPGVSVGATLEDVKLLHQKSNGRFGIKPAGGVGTFEDAKNMWYAVGAPTLENGDIDPYLFRIGSSSLLGNLQGKISNEASY